MRVKHSDRKAKSKRNDVHVVARNALASLLRPLAGFVLDTGLSASELQRLYRVAAVRSAADRQRESTNRVSISGIAASTGISRAEISQILRMSVRQQPADYQQQSTNRILFAWHEDPKYTNADGDPADLVIFGSGVTFESLVKAHGRGIPARAMLDELARTGSVKVLSSRKVRVKSLVAVDRGIGPRAVKLFGDRATELLSTMLLNMRLPEKYRFLSSVDGVVDNQETLPVIRREISKKGADFLAGIRGSLLRDPLGSPGVQRKSNPVRVGVTIYYHEARDGKILRGKPWKPRRNLRRTSR